ncbi:hypothetical protein HZS_6052 [Henneguya salminicola]|nr:hypothetical protein HZS_6052 [Henneguya salminicola]
MIVLEKKFNDVSKFFCKLYDKIEELLQPNTAARQIIKLNETINMKSQKEKYTHVEELLSALFCAYNETTNQGFGDACGILGDKFKLLVEINEKKDFQMRIEVMNKINYIKKSEITEIQKQIKKHNKHRLEFDSIRMKKDMQKEIETAKSKYQATKITCYNMLVEFLDNSQKQHTEILLKFCQILNEYYTHSMEVNQDAATAIGAIINDLSSKNPTPLLQNFEPISINGESYDEFTENNEKPSQPSKIYIKKDPKKLLKLLLWNLILRHAQ